MKADNPLDARSSGRTICRLSLAAAVIALLLCASGLRASDSGEEDSAGDSVQTIAPDEKLIVVVGAAGAKEFRDTFNSAADAWADLAERQGWQMCRIAEDESGATCKEQLRNALKTSGEQRLWLVLIGHGTFAANIAKFNLAGPDISATELAEWLDELSCPQVIINCASASAPFMTKLAADNRIVITATQSGSEYNYTRFGEYLAQTINDPGVDLDHDQEVSLLEAFLAASKLTQRFYQDASRLATEHALLNDNGDRVGTSGDFYRGVRPVKRSEQGIIDGDAAARIIVLNSSSNPVFSTQLNQERVAVEAKISALRSRKALLDEIDYYNQLEGHLLELAAIYDRAESDQHADDAESAPNITPEEADSETDIQNRTGPDALTEQPLDEDVQDEQSAVQDRKESKENADRR